MKIGLLLAIVIATATPAWAGQGCPGGMPGGAPMPTCPPAGGAPGGAGAPKAGDPASPEEAATLQRVVLRFYSSSATAGSTLEAVLAKVRGARKVEADRDTGTVGVDFAGSPRQMQQLEAAGSAAGIPVALVSHARFGLTFKAKSAADQKAFIDGVSAIWGLHSIRVVSAGNAEAIVDFAHFEWDALAEAADAAKVEFKCTTHEWVTIKISAEDAAGLRKDLLATKGVLRVVASASRVDAWMTKKALGDPALRKLADKNNVSVVEIARS